MIRIPAAPPGFILVVGALHSALTQPERAPPGVPLPDSGDSPLFGDAGRALRRRASSRPISQNPLDDRGIRGSPAGGSESGGTVRTNWRLLSPGGLSRFGRSTGSP